MGYIKVTDDGYIIGIGENPKKEGNLSEKEYKELSEVFAKMPEPKEGYVVKLREKDLTWIQVEKPEEPDPDKSGLTPDDAWKIIESSNISKENKQLLKDYIYKEG